MTDDFAELRAGQEGCPAKMVTDEAEENAATQWLVSGMGSAGVLGVLVFLLA